MSEHACLQAVADRRPMSTTIFDLRRAEQAGQVTMEMAGPVARWKLTPAGAERLRGLAEEAARNAPPAVASPPIDDMEDAE